MDWLHHHHRDVMTRDRIQHGRPVNRLPPRIGMPGGGGGNHIFNPGMPMGLDRRIDGPNVLHPEGRNLPRRDGSGLLHAGADGSRRPGLLDVSIRRMAGPDLFPENAQRRMNGPGLLHPVGGRAMRPVILHPQGDYGMRRFQARADGPGIPRLDSDCDWRPGNDEAHRMMRPEGNLAARRMEGILPPEHENGFWRGDSSAFPRPEMNTFRRSEGPLPEGNRRRMENNAIFKDFESPALLPVVGDGLLNRVEGSGLSQPEGSIAGRGKEPTTHLESKKPYRRIDGHDTASMDADKLRAEGLGIRHPTLGIPDMDSDSASGIVDGRALLCSWRKYGGTQLKGDDSTFRTSVLMADAATSSSKYGTRYDREPQNQAATARSIHAMSKPVDGSFDNHNVATLDKSLEDTEDTIIDNLEKSGQFFDEGSRKSSVFDAKSEAPLRRSPKDFRILENDKIVGVTDSRLIQNRRLGSLYLARRVGTDSLSPSDDGKGSRTSLHSTGSRRSRITSLPLDEDKTRGKLSEDENSKDSDDGSMQELVMQYKVALAELTFNSKPIITNLTIIAGENLHAANVIAMIICDHILEVPIEQKLPCLYLLDSIVKNIRSTYVSCFSSRLPEIFIKSYRQMDPSLHPAMQHLFKTWRGIYDEPLHVIERELGFNILGSNTTSLPALPLSNHMKSDDSLSHRSGPSIHVNPKYLEAQRQKVKQTSPVDDVPQMPEVCDALVEATDPVSTISSPDPCTHDYESGEWEEERRRIGESLSRKKWTREDGSVADAVENTPLTHGIQSGFELPKLAPEPLLDIYGNVRGIRAPKIPPTLVFSNNENFSNEGSWKSVEDAEYHWGDVNLRRPDVPAEDSLKSGRVEKFHCEDLLAKRGKPITVDHPWEFDGSAEARGSRDWKDMSFLQQDQRSNLAVDPILEVPNFARSGHDTVGYCPSGVHSPSPLPHGGMILPHSLQINRKSSSPVRPAFGAPMSASDGLSMVTSLSALSRPGEHFETGSSSGQGDYNFRSSSPNIGPLAFQQSQQAERPYSPPPFAALHNLHIRSPLIVSSTDKQSMQSPSQQPPPLPPPPPTRLPQRSHFSQYASQGIQQSLQAPQPQSSNQPPIQSVKLFESLQQLQHQVPFVSIGQSVQPPLPSGQPGVFVQHSLNRRQTPINVDTLGLSGIRNADVLSAGTSPSACGTHHVPSVFMGSEAVPPPQGSQIIPNPSMLSSEPSKLGVSQSLVPPPPSGPPPLAYSAEANLLPAQLVATALATSSSSLMSTVVTNGLPQAYASTWGPQPPLPPGPPPIVSQIEGSKSTPTLPSCKTSTSGTDITSLLSSLVAHGVISAVPQTSSLAQTISNMASEFSQASSSAGIPSLGIPSLEIPTEKNVPINEGSQSNHGLFEFKQEQLRERHEAVVNALYCDFPRQCKTCGLRFKLQEEHCNHMDWHVSRNRRQNPLKKISRKWFVSVKEWLNGTGSAGNEVASSFPLEDAAWPKEEDEVVAVPADENQIACALCGEPFEDFYSDEMEEWMYKGAVYMNASVGSSLDAASRGPIVHAKCRSESATDIMQDTESEVGSSRIKRARL